MLSWRKCRCLMNGAGTPAARGSRTSLDCDAPCAAECSAWSTAFLKSTAVAKLQRHALRGNSRNQRVREFTKPMNRGQVT